MIAMAILSSQEKKLVLADIYQYVLDNFPYFRHRGQGWRNSIRHNLSLNDFFLKAGRAANGKGHYWAVHPACVQDFQKGDFRRRRAQRKVRKHMGMHVDDEEEDDSPPASPPSFEHAPLPLDTFISEETKLKDDTEVALPSKHKAIVVMPKNRIRLTIKRSQSRRKRLREKRKKKTEGEKTLIKGSTHMLELVL